MFVSLMCLRTIIMMPSMGVRNQVSLKCQYLLELDGVILGNLSSHVPLARGGLIML